MKLILCVLLLTNLWGDGNITKTTKANNAKKTAESAFKNKDYAKAISQYNLLLDSLKIKDEKAALNRAHSYYLMNDTSNAVNQYMQLTTSAEREVKSIAYQQLGVMNEKQGDLKGALSQFKNALKTNPENEEARYNYELVKKKLKNQQEQEKKDEENKDEKSKDGENKEQEKKEQEGDKKDDQKQQNQEGKKDDQKKEGEQGKDGEKSKEQENKEEKSKDGKEKDEKSKEDGEPLTPEEQKKQEEEAKRQAQMQRFEDVDMSEDKAKMILNAMKQSEKQYLQQLKKNPTQRPDSDKPDW